MQKNHASNAVPYAEKPHTYAKIYNICGLVRYVTFL